MATRRFTSTTAKFVRSRSAHGVHGPRQMQAQSGVRQAVFVHGLGGSARNWTDFDVLVVTCCWWHCTGPPRLRTLPHCQRDRDYSQAAHAQSVIRLIEDRCDGPIDLLGNSMGGAISEMYSALRARPLCAVLCWWRLPARLPPAPQVSPPDCDDCAGPGRHHFEGYQVRGRRGTVDRMHNLCFLDTARVHPQRREIQIEKPVGA